MCVNMYTAAFLPGDRAASAVSSCSISSPPDPDLHPGHPLPETQKHIGHYQMVQTSITPQSIIVVIIGPHFLNDVWCRLGTLMGSVVNAKHLLLNIYVFLSVEANKCNRLFTNLFKRLSS